MWGVSYTILTRIFYRFIDAEDEALNRWKASLGIGKDAGAASIGEPGDMRKVSSTFGHACETHNKVFFPQLNIELLYRLSSSSSLLRSKDALVLSSTWLHLMRWKTSVPNLLPLKREHNSECRSNSVFSMKWSLACDICSLWSVRGLKLIRVKRWWEALPPTPTRIRFTRRSVSLTGLELCCWPFFVCSL